MQAMIFILEQAVVFGGQKALLSAMAVVTRDVGAYEIAAD
jgi:acetyltransferase-like isoleucine patch superfamily enzyme